MNRTGICPKCNRPGFFYESPHEAPNSNNRTSVICVTCKAREKHPGPMTDPVQGARRLKIEMESTGEPLYVSGTTQEWWLGLRKEVNPVAAITLLDSGAIEADVNEDGLACWRLVG